MSLSLNFMISYVNWF